MKPVALFLVVLLVAAVVFTFLFADLALEERKAGARCGSSFAGALACLSIAIGALCNLLGLDL